MERVPVPEEAVFRLVDAVERAGIDYAIKDGLALNAWGIPRASYDLDAALAVEAGDTVRALVALQGQGVEIGPHFLQGYVDELAGRGVSIVTAADLILFKLIAGRRKDWVDVDNVIAVQGVPERGYLTEWANRLGVRERLDRVLLEAAGG